ncbi:hypothetical protein [Bacillus sp. OV322]|uniref:hypothetical protein n=1 Tax=Bacillus sp. OV322 TaxID=1882764 RepID=UPI000B83179A|nr:hypothetical protein [Bacillus sp. OV322]
MPADQLVRKIESAIDFSFIYDLVKDMYSDVGRPNSSKGLIKKVGKLMIDYEARYRENQKKELARWKELIQNLFGEVPKDSVTVTDKVRITKKG